MVVTGDVTQIDLPRAKQSGLRQPCESSAVRQVDLFHFDGQDVVRHPLVQDIINAYAEAEQAEQHGPRRS